MKPQKTRGSKVVLVIDDDPLVLEATAGLIESWGCNVLAAPSSDVARALLARLARGPDFIICDYRLSGRSTGIEVLNDLCRVYDVPALLISGDAVSPSGDGPGGSSYHFLHKPLDAAHLRAALIGASVLQR